VRELENVIARMVVLSHSEELTLMDLPAFLRLPPPSQGTQTMTLPDEGLNLPHLERNVILASLRKFKGNQSDAARYLSITRKVLINRIAKFQIQGAEWNDQAASSKG
jgi:two-component system NtrC family response regulator